MEGREANSAHHDPWPADVLVTCGEDATGRGAWICYYRDGRPATLHTVDDVNRIEAELGAEGLSFARCDCAPSAGSPWSVST